MARSQRKHDRVAFVACTSLAIGIIVVIWVMSMRAIVGQGVQGTKNMVSEVSATAGEIRRQTAPDPETVADIKGALMEIVTKPSEEAAEEPAPSGAPEAPVDDETVDAVAKLMKNDVETYGEEPKE